MCLALMRFSWLLFMVFGILWIYSKRPVQPKHHNLVPFTELVRQHLTALFQEHGPSFGREDFQDVTSRRDWCNMLAYAHSHVVGPQQFGLLRFVFVRCCKPSQSKLGMKKFQEQTSESD